MATTPSAQQLAIVNLYTSLFNRAPDADGLSFWTQALSSGISLTSITQGFLGTAEATAIYPVSQTSEQFVTAFYKTVFGRAPDTEGLAFWTNALNAAGGSGSAAAKAMLVSQIDAVVNTPLPTKPAAMTDAQYAQTVADRATFANKVAAGVYYAIEVKGNNVGTAKSVLSGVNASATSVDAAKVVSDGSVVVAPPAPSTPPQVLVGTAGNDVFNLTHLTIRAGDSIDGAAGTDTLNYVDSSSTGATLSGVAVSNVETVNIRNVNTAGASFESNFYRAPTSLVSGQSLSIAGGTVTATGGDATAAQIAIALATGVSSGNAFFSGLMTGYTATANNGTVSFTSTVRGNVPDLNVSGTSTALGTFEFRSQGRAGILDTVAASNFVGATSLNSDLSIAPVTFDGLSAAQTLGLIGNGVIANGNLTGNYASTVPAATLNLVGGTKVDTLTVTGLGLTSVTVNSTGAANLVTTLALAASTTALSINAVANLTLASTGPVYFGGITAPALSSVTVSGAAASVVLGTLASSVLTTVNASGLAGGVSATLGAAPAATFVGGAGNDTITVAAGAVITGTYNAGAGTADAIGFLAGASLTSATAALITNFEVLQLSATGATTQTYDTTLVAGITSLKVAVSTGSVVLTKLAAGAAVTVAGHVTGSDGLSLVLNDATGPNDIFNVTLDNGFTDATVPSVGLSVSSLKAVGVETINLHSLGLVTNGLSGNFVSNDIANTTLSKVVIDGNRAMTFTTGALTGGVELSIDASTATGFLTVNDGPGASVASKALTIKAGVAGSRISSGTAGDAITLAATGNGVDTIVYKTLGLSSQDFVNAAGSASAKQDTIVNFVSGTDKIDLSGIAFASAANKFFVDKNFATTDDLVTAENAGASFFQDGANVRGAVAAHIGGDTYLVIDASGNGTFDLNSDLVIKLTGVTVLAQADLIFSQALQ